MTHVENAYEELLFYQHTARRAMKDAAKWIEKHNFIEEEISRSGAETLGDVLIKLDILCGRLEQAHVDHGDLNYRSVDKERSQAADARTA